MPWVTAHHPRPDELSACVQCGLCLPVCPTFRLTGRETASPRGRLHAMMAVAEGVVEVDRTFADIIDFCLGCRACEPICPGLVPYGRALEGARAEIAAQMPERVSRARRMQLGVVGRRWMLRVGARLLSTAQRLRLKALVPAGLRQLASGARGLEGRGPATLGHEGGSGGEGLVGLLVGCVQDEWFRPVNRAAITLLEMAGYRVEAPVSQTCCGALAAHEGLAAAAVELASGNVAAFSDCDIVVSTAAGCSAHLRGYGHLVEGGERLAERAVDVTVVVARAIAEGRLPTILADNGKVGIQDPCHLRHAQRVIEEPRAILRAAGYEVVEIDGSGMCCGAAGTYASRHPATAAELGNLKADQVRSTGVSRVASANPGCEMQLRSHLGGTVDLAHPVEWYLEALQGAQ